MIPGQENPLEKERATQIPWTKRSGRLQSMGLQRIRHGLATKQQPSSEVDLGTGNSRFCRITSPRTYLLLASLTVKSPVFFFLCWLCLCILIAWLPLHHLISKYYTQTHLHLFISLDSGGSHHRWVLCICSSLPWNSLLSLSCLSSHSLSYK